MERETRIARYGNSLNVRVPAALARELDLREGDRVMIRSLDDGLFISRSGRSRLADLLASVREPEAEIATGPALGAESIE